MQFNNISFTLIITLIFGGIICASIYSYYTKKVLGEFIKRLNDKGITSEESALSVKELGYSTISAFFIGLSLGESSSLRRYVKACLSKEERDVLKEEKGIDAKFWLDDETKETALERYNGEGMKLWKLLVGIVACIVAAILCVNVFPHIVRMFMGAGESFKVNNDVVGTRTEDTVMTLPEEEEKPVEKAEEK